jgi:hypothetical protein
VEKALSETLRESSGKAEGEGRGALLGDVVVLSLNLRFLPSLPN